MQDDTTAAVPVTPSPDVRRINVTVACVLLCFGFLYYVAVALVLVPWLSFSVPGLTNFTILSFNTALALYCYLFCVFVDPGKVPQGWQPDQEACSVQEVKKSGGARYCQKCQRWKPPRSHHCRVCRRCVLRMDHHCPWTNSCIGHANHRAFLHFLIYVSAALVHTLRLIVAHALHTLQTSQQRGVIRTGPQSIPIHLREEGLQRVWLWAAMQTLAFALALPITLGLVMLLVWHLQLTCHNKTTIEYQEGVTASIQAAAGGAGLALHPYDLGLCANLHEAMGESLASWVLPPCSGTPGGTRYPTVWDERALGLS